MKKIIAIALVLMLCVSALSVTAFAADTITVYVSIDSASAPYAWAWGGYGNAFSASWPGVPMTRSGDWWKIEVPTGTTGFIVNNGNSSSTTKTSDIAISGDKDVWITVSADYKSYSVSYDGGNTIAPPPAAPEGYFVTGDASWLGSWAECNQAGKMTEQSGIYVKEFTGVAAGSYSLKVNDGTWANSWGGDGENGNYDFTVDEANSTVTVKFNPADNTVTVEVNGPNAGGEVVTPPPAVFDAYYVAGTAGLCNGVEWDPAAAVNAMTKGDDGIWTITFSNVPAGEHKLKVTAGSWDNCWGDAEGGDADGNVVINLEEAAEKITVKFNPATNFVSVYNGENPLTSDVSLAGVAVALLAATAGVVALVGMKKKED